MPVEASLGHAEAVAQRGDADTAEGLVAARDVCHTVEDGRGRMDVALKFDLPQNRALRRRKRIQESIVGPDEDAVAGNDGRGSNLTGGLERPDGFARLRVDRVERAGEIADEDHAVRHGRR